MGLAGVAAEYRIPKREILVEVLLLSPSKKVVHNLMGRRVEKVSFWLFLSERVATREGAERLSDLLNSPGEFLPAMESAGSVVLLNKDAVMVLSAPAEAEFPDEDAEPAGGARSAGVLSEVTLLDGTELKGEVPFVMPEAKRRLVDFLNLPERYFALRQGETVQLINKRCIVRVSIVGSEAGK